MPKLKIKIPSFIKNIGIQFHKFFWLINRIVRLKITRWIIIFVGLLLSLPMLFFIRQRPIPAEDIEFGVTFSNKYATQLGLDWQDAYIKTLDDLNVKKLRLIAYWDETEPEK